MTYSSSRMVIPHDPTHSGRAASARLHLLGSLGLICTSLVVGLLALEVGCRLLNGRQALLDWHNLVLASRIAEERTAIVGVKSSYDYDPTLGFVNRPGFSSDRIHFDASGFRSTQPLAPDGILAPPILATGDSFTKGDEVADFETWPAQLQSLLNWRTINAGVGAYGLDQTILLTERLVRLEKPAMLVLGFIADDVRRAEMSRMWGREKPYYEQAGSELLLRNVPVPQQVEPRDSLSALQAAVGWSVLLDVVLDRLKLRNAWHMDHVRALRSGAGELLACPLMRQVASLGVPTLVVAQYLPSAWRSPDTTAEERRVSGAVLSCARQAGLSTLDMYEMFDSAIRTGGVGAVYGQWHPNAHGNHLTAIAIAVRLGPRLR